MRSHCDVPPDPAVEVLRYFLRNPRAADNLEGVVRWRLEEQRVHRTVAEVDAAMTWLVARGFLLEEPVYGTGSVFRLAASRCGAAKRLVQRVVRNRMGA
jgi:hypothetical protein